MSGNLRNLFCLLILLCVAGMSAAHADGQDKTPVPEDEKSPASKAASKPAKGVTTKVTSSRSRSTPPRVSPTNLSLPRPGAIPPGFSYMGGETIERSMMVDPNVALKMCVANADLNINGWHRNEVRVFV